MAHGAPDHTRLSDDAFSHYRDKWAYRPWGALMAGDPANYIVNQSIVGVIGDIYVLTNDPGVTLKIEIDGVGIYSWDITALVSLGQWGYSNLQFKMSCTKYDAVLSQYAMIFSGNHQMYVHKSLKAWLVRTGAGDAAAGYCWYKEKI